MIRPIRDIRDQSNVFEHVLRTRPGIHPGLVWIRLPSGDQAFRHPPVLFDKSIRVRSYAVEVPGTWNRPLKSENRRFHRLSKH